MGKDGDPTCPYQPRRGDGGRTAYFLVLSSLSLPVPTFSLRVCGIRGGIEGPRGRIAARGAHLGTRWGRGDVGTEQAKWMQP